MCGIVYSENFTGQPVNEQVFDRYMAQRNRGTDGFGLFNGTHLVHAAKENRIVNWLAKPKNNSSLLLFHHRYPTSTVNVRRAAHPFSTRDYFGDTQYILVHNGYIGNANELFCEHQELGINYHSLLDDLTFNDSEALLWDFALYMEGKQPDLTAYGHIAFICLKLEKGKLTKMYFARNGWKPLVMNRTKVGLTLSSEGYGEEIKSHILHTWNYALKRLTKKTLFIDNMKPYVYDNSYHVSEPYTAPTWDEDDDYLERAYRPPSKAPAGEWLGPALTKKFGKYLAEKPRKRSFYQVEPSQSQIDSHLMAYLAMSNGVFEVAYYHMEWEYSQELDDADMTGDYSRCRLMERAMEAITKDPEYLDDKSVSSRWRNVCAQRTLV